MGFKTLAIQKRSGEVWRVLGAIKTEFEKFGGMLEKAQKNLHTASNQLDELVGKRTKAIQRRLRDVESLPQGEASGFFPWTRWQKLDNESDEEDQGERVPNNTDPLTCQQKCMSIIKQEFLEARSVLESFLSDETNFDRIEQAGSMMVDALKGGHKLISCGNGGSMCDAMHFAEELSGLYRNRRKALAAISISDPSHITCAGNDFGFDHIFSRYVEAMGQDGDVLLAISTSGNSANVINAANAAKSKGMKVIGLTGKEGGQTCRSCDVETARTVYKIFRPHPGNSYQDHSCTHSLY